MYPILTKQNQNSSEILYRHQITFSDTSNSLFVDKYEFVNENGTFTQR